MIKENDPFDEESQSAPTPQYDYARRVLFSLFFILALTGLVVIVWKSHGFIKKQGPVPTQDQMDSYTAFNSIFFHPSFETTPVLITYGKNRYKIPRNYIVQEDNWQNPSLGAVTLRMTVPGFEPLTKKTEDCMSKAPAYRPKGCSPIDVILQETDDTSEDLGFKNFKQVFRSPIPLKGDFGFELYLIGREGVPFPQEVYRKVVNGHTLIFDCFGTLKEIEMNIRKGAFCRTTSRLPNQNSIKYMIDRWPGYTGDQLATADQIDAGIRNTIMSFTVEGE